MKPLPENFLKCMTPEARKSVGQRTAAEVMANGVATSEKALQRQIVGLLRLKGIEVNVSRMDKRKTDRVGWPDLTFAVERRRELITVPGKIVSDGVAACAWEIKTPTGTGTVEQAELHYRLRTRPNGWTVKVIRSVDEALAELKEMGLE